jgi:hypothetical protein
MKETNCKFCGDTVILPDNDEQIVETTYETDMQHFRRTGHGQRQPDHYHNGDEE